MRSKCVDGADALRPGGYGCGADLAVVPEPSAGLDTALRRLYPQRLRGLAISGDAVIRVRISPTGAPQPIRVVRASEPEFGEACMDGLRSGGNWTPAIGREGHPVATKIRFHCEFSLDWGSALPPSGAAPPKSQAGDPYRIGR